MRRKVGELDILAAAYLSSQGLRQEQIAKTLDVSQAVVSRLLKEARDKKLLKLIVALSPEITGQRKAEIEARIFPQKLMTDLNDIVKKEGGTTLLHSVRVFGNNKNGGTRADWATRLETFGQSAGGYVRELLLSAKVVGVPWGNTIASVIKGVAQLPAHATRKDHSTAFVPLCGEPLGSSITFFSSSSLASKLYEAVNGESRHALSLAGVPALIPLDFTRSEVEVVNKLIGRMGTYNEIFLGEKKAGNLKQPLIDRVDTILTSVGPSEGIWNWNNTLVEAVNINGGKLRDLIVGDLAGVLIPRSNLKISEEKELRDIEMRWTGVKMEHLRRCAEKAFKSVAPGIIVVAIGNNKAKIVFEAVRRGLVNHLLVDQDLADEIKRLMGD